jgi:hypothetical protein
VVSETTDAPPWTPASITSSARWYDAGDVLALDGASPSTLQDGSVNNDDLDVTGAPAWYENTSGGYPHFRFDGVDDGYRKPTAITSTSQPWTMAGVYRFRNPGGNPSQAAVSVGTNGRIGVGSSKLIGSAGGGINGPNQDANWHTVIFVGNGASSKLIVDGVQYTGNGGAGLMRRLAIGLNVSDTPGTQNLWFDGDVTAATMMPGDVSANATNQANLQTWLNQRKPTTYQLYGSSLTDNVNMLLVTGQSLALGYGSYPALTTTAEHPNNVYRPGSGGYVPLVSAVGGEQYPEQSLANQVYEDDPNAAAKWAIYTSGASGQGYGSLKKGTVVYDANLAAVTNAKNKTSGTTTVRALHIIHGEYHIATGTGATSYESYLNEWLTDYNTDVKAITGQSNDIIAVLTQPHNFTFYRDGGFTNMNLFPFQAILDFHKNNANAYLAGPTYHLPSNDGLHLSNLGYYYMGEYHAKVVDRVIHDGGSWDPMRPTSIVRTGANIDVTFNVPVGNLTIDTSTVAAQANYGFHYTDDSGAPPAIASVTVTGSNTMRVQLASVPSGSNPKLGYAMDATANGLGNIRDQDPAVSDYNGYPLYNWCVNFLEAVTN